MPEGIPYGVPGKTPQNPDPTIDNWLRNLLGGEPEGGDPTSGLGILPQSPMQGSPASGQLRGMQVGQIPEDMNTPPPLPLPVTAPPPSILPPIPGIDPIAEEPGAIDALAFEDLRGAGAGMESILANPPAAAQPQQAAAQPATQPAAATVQQEPPVWSLAAIHQCTLMNSPFLLTHSSSDSVPLFQPQATPKTSYLLRERLRRK